MSRPSRLEILKYALEGARTERGVWSGAMGEAEEEQLDADIEWLEAEIARVEARQSS